MAMSMLMSVGPKAERFQDSRRQGYLLQRSSLSSTVPIKGRVVYAGPTCGKTTLMHYLASIGVACIDTDDVIKIAYPTWFVEKIWRKATPYQQRLLDDKVGRWVKANASDRLIFTNLWGKNFRQHVLGTPTARYEVGAYREPAWINRYSVERGGSEIPVALAEHWFSGTITTSAAAFDSLLILGGRTYLADCITFTNIPTPGKLGKLVKDFARSNGPRDRIEPYLESLKPEWRSAADI